MKKFLLVISCLFLILSSSTISVFAEYDGKPKSNPFGDTGAAPTLGGKAKYFDWFCPYATSFYDIGGYADDVIIYPGSNYSKSKFVFLSDKDAKKKYFYSALNREKTKSEKVCGKYDPKIEADTGVNYVDVDGCKFYLTAIPAGVYNYSAADFVFGGGTFADEGYIVDMILKDGTVIHFAAVDGIGGWHSNNKKGEVDPGGKNSHDKLAFSFTELRLPQYKRTFHATSPNQLFEMFCKDNDSIKKFSSKYKISKNNPIYAVRLWNKSLKDGFKVTSGVKGFAHNSSGALKGDSSDESGKKSKTTSKQFMSGVYEERDLGAWNKLVEENIQESYLDNVTREKLEQDDLSSLADWSSNVENSKAEYGFIAMMRIIVMWVGIFFTVWVLFIYLAYWFDRLNTFFYLDLLHILTFGKLHISPEEKECTFGKNNGSSKDITVNHKAILMICITGLIFGTLIISGVFYTVVSGAVNFVLRQLGI